jgi:hypothetical protein
MLYIPIAMTTSPKLILLYTTQDKNVNILCRTMEVGKKHNLKLSPSNTKAVDDGDVRC